MINFKDVLQHSLCEGLSFTGDHQMPRVSSYLGDLPKELISFNRARALKNGADAGVHFYIRDVFFECFWNCPQRYLEMFKKFSCVISTDFSVYANMTFAEVLWTHIVTNFLQLGYKRMVLP